MKKRTADEVEQDGEEQRSLKHGNIQRSNENGNDEGPFEDDFEDEFESEDEIMEAGVDGRPDEEREAEEAGTMEVDRQTFIPGRHKLAPGEILAPDLSTYEMLHTLGAPISCLSFDFIRDHLGDGRARQKYPATVYAVAGTQAERGREKENQILVMKMSKLSKMERSPDEDSDNEDEDDEDENTDPVLESRSIRLNAGTNRIRVHQTPHTDASVPAQTLTATMTDTGQVLIHDITPHLTSFDTPGYITTPERSQPIHVIKSHRSTEGYAIDWSKTTAQRRLLTGDNDGRIFLTTQNNDATWSTDARPYIGHTGSVEELQWSPTEQNVFASGSSDGTVKIWDTRSKAHKPYISVQVSESDVNVLSWSRLQTHLLATGAEDGTWAVWDLRQWKPTSGATAAEGTKPTPVASFNFHKEQVISVEWHPTDDSIVAVAAGDNTMTLWDLAVELDDEESKYTADAKDVPPQLLFVHYMDSVKECHWHPQIAGVIMGTGHNFDVFKTINV